MAVKQRRKTMRYMTKFVMSLIVMLPLSCGGTDDGTEGEAEAEAEAEAEGEAEAEAEAEAEGETGKGLLVVSAGPSLAGDPLVKLLINYVVETEFQAGGETQVEVDINPTPYVKLEIPGYGWAVPGYQFSGDVNEWEINGLEIAENATVELHATLCRDLTGRWTDGVVTRDVTMLATEEGYCAAIGFPCGNVRVEGDSVRTSGDNLYPILENGSRVEIGESAVCTRLE